MPARARPAARNAAAAAAPSRCRPDRSAAKRDDFSPQRRTRRTGGPKGKEGSALVISAWQSARQNHSSSHLSRRALRIVCMWSMGCYGPTPQSGRGRPSSAPWREGGLDKSCRRARKRDLDFSAPLSGGLITITRVQQVFWICPLEAHFTPGIRLPKGVRDADPQFPRVRVVQALTPLRRSSPPSLVT